MTDRVPGAPGQYKAVVTDSELEKMQSGEEFTITLTRDDHPITEGTPYSKAAVLPDSLAAILCPEVEDPTPADALRGLYNKGAESSLHPGCYYRTVDGQTEWLNPPMAVGTEYRTTQRMKGKPIYVKHIEQTYPDGVGNLTTYKDYTISHGITDIDHLVSVEANLDAIYPLPYVDTTGGWTGIVALEQNNLRLRTYKAKWDSSITVHATICYTKV